MNKKILIVLSLVSSLAACTETPVKVEKKSEPSPVLSAHIPDQRVGLGMVSMSGPLSYSYKIYGDPMIAPEQVFSDSRFIYMQLKNTGVTPIPTTRDGKLIEYEVKRGFMVMPKVDSMVLRVGPRKAYVDAKELEIIHYQPVIRQASAPSELNVEITSPVMQKPEKTAEQKPELKPEPKPVVMTEHLSKYIFNVESVMAASTPIDLGLKGVDRFQWRICSPANSLPFKASLKLELMLAKEGWKASLDPKCTPESNDIVLEKI